MNKNYLNTNVTLVILLLFSISGRAQELEPKNELRIYERPTQIGTVASREFKDDKGRVVKVIYYTQGGSSAGPFREELLREQSIRTYRYDDHGCPIKSESYEPGAKLSRNDEVRCFDGTATPSLTIIRNALGIKQAEIRHTTSGRNQTILYFDNDGDKVINISGELPTDADLSHGWGDLLNGLACGVAANREMGRQEDLKVHVTIKNVSHYGNDVVMISPIRVELKDVTGRVVERKGAHRTDENRTQSDDCPSYGKEAAPSVGRSQQEVGYALGEHYGRLRPGKYSITVTYCVSGIPEQLVSNTILLEVEAGKIQ